MIRPVGVGFKSLAPTGVVGFRITTACPAWAACDRFLLGQKLRSLVMADHVGERDRRVPHRRSSHRCENPSSPHWMYRRSGNALLRARAAAGSACHRHWPHTSLADRAPKAGNPPPHASPHRNRETRRCAKISGSRRSPDHGSRGECLQDCQCGSSCAPADADTRPCRQALAPHGCPQIQSRR